MKIDEFKALIARMEPLLRDETIDTESYLLFILKNIPGEHINEKELSDIFSYITLSPFIKQGQKIINTGLGDIFILGGERVDFSQYRDRYIEIFALWAQKSWISIAKDSAGLISIHVNQPS